MNVPQKVRSRARRYSQRLCLPLVLLAAVLTGAGCSSFERAWRTAGESPHRHDAITGRWDGSWRSDVNGHNDRLRCLVTPQTNGVYSARFHAKYKKGIFRFTFGYTVPLRAERAGEVVQFQGEADLGWLAGGVYRYQGTATATNFFSTYRSKYDHGVFQMTRPPDGQ